MDIDFDDTLFESTWYMQNNVLQPGTYTLMYDTISPKTGEIIATSKSKIVVDENCLPVGTMLGAPIYEVTHLQTQQKIFINPAEIIR
jgi:hypothetical protein